MSNTFVVGPDLKSDVVADEAVAYTPEGLRI
jgi:hypothetical protein